MDNRSVFLFVILYPQVLQIGVGDQAGIAVLFRATHGSLLLLVFASGAFRLIDLHVNASIALRANDLKHDAQGTGRLAFATNDIPHVLRVYVEGQKDSAFINRSFDFDVVGMVHD